MSRSTQFIGLNASAHLFLVTQNVEGSLSGFYAVGLCGEEIPLHKYIGERGQVYLEVLDVEFWSGGPVILTCLSEEGCAEKICGWKEDVSPSNSEYIDREKGIYHT